MLIYKLPSRYYRCTCFGSTYTKIGTIQRRLAWPLRKDDTQIREAFHIFRGKRSLGPYLELSAFVRIPYEQFFKLVIRLLNSTTRPSLNCSNDLVGRPVISNSCRPHWDIPGIEQRRKPVGIDLSRDFR